MKKFLIISLLFLSCKKDKNNQISNNEIVLHRDPIVWVLINRPTEPFQSIEIGLDYDIYTYGISTSIQPFTTSGDTINYTSAWNRWVRTYNTTVDTMYMLDCYVTTYSDYWVYKATY